MGWAVGWDFDHGRHRGYGVPAFCDAKECREEIDRGLGFVCECDEHRDDDLACTIFVCGEHSCADVEESALPPEHPDWLRHVLTDESWENWRDEEPALVETYRAQLAEATT